MLNKMIIIAFLGMTSCAGGRGYLRFEALKYPASTSPYLYGRSGDVVPENKGLSVIGTFTTEKKFWGMVYSLVRLSDDADVTAAANDAIEKARGDGLINLTITTDSCALTGVPILPILPFWPACTIAKIKADIVKESR